jgi:hypothetical protein
VGVTTWASGWWRESALEWMLQSGDLEDGARNFGVSVELFRWRVNHTGVVRQVEKERRHAGRA